VALRPDRMQVIPDRTSYVRGFVYQSGGASSAASVPYLPDEIVWFRRFNPMDEFSGASAVAPIRSVIDMATEATVFNRNFFINSAMPSDVVVTTEETPTDDEASAFMSLWEGKFRGSGNAHRPMLLSSGMDMKKLGVSHREMEFIEALKWSVEEVSRVLGVPKAFLSDLSEATFANINAEERFFWRNTILPELRLIEDEINRSLVPHFGSQGDINVSFDTSDVEALQENETERAKRLVLLVDSGVLTVNEAREREELEPVAWGSGAGAEE
jgi:HK97 family phage portal protein